MQEATPCCTMLAEQLLPSSSCFLLEMLEMLSYHTTAHQLSKAVRHRQTAQHPSTIHPRLLCVYSCSCRVQHCWQGCWNRHHKVSTGARAGLGSPAQQTSSAWYVSLLILHSCSLYLSRPACKRHFNCIVQAVLLATSHA